MSAVAARLGRRTFAVDHARPEGGPVPLSDLRPGETARIRGYSPALSAAYGRRLFDLGFAPGASITVVRRAPTLDPVVFRVAECEIALRRSLARGIVVDRA